MSYVEDEVRRLTRDVLELKSSLKAVTMHLNLVIEPGYTDQFGAIMRLPQVRDACKECGK